YHLRALIGLALALGASACLSASVLSDFAADQFSEQELCPRDSFTTREFGLRPQDLLLAGAPPSDDVAAAKYRDLTVVDARGCATHLTYFCWRDADQAQRFCQEMNLADPGARLESFKLKPAARKALRQRLGF
ncbi:MAG TPA: hypothetical protein VLX28_21575, partial [Thermoanaerobaculia bacterium]|nr:hypothetical protein [Thermoanaerobaculia bacterium]